MISFADSLRKPIIIVLFFWILKMLEWIYEIQLSYFFGLYPRTPLGILGIFTSTFVHGDLAHLASNTVPFVVLMAGILFFYPTVSKKVILFIYITTGIGVWLFARSSIHIGASGLVYGFATFLFFSGIFLKNVQAMSISAVVAILYGGMVEGILPQDENISWESHLIGAVVGGFAAYYFKNDSKNSLDQNTSTSYIYEQEGYQNIENAHFKYYFKEKEPKK